MSTEKSNQETTSNELYTLLCAVRDSLNVEVRNLYETTLKNDIGSLDIYTDPMQTKSFARGKSIGLLIARDRINKALEEHCN